jgi:hypothetical protein
MSSVYRNDSVNEPVLDYADRTDCDHTTSSKTLYERLNAAGAVRVIYARESPSHARRSGTHRPQSRCVQVLHVAR